MKRYSMLHQPETDRYHIGYLIREWKGERYWAIVESRWSNMQRMKFDSLDDIIELGPNDNKTFMGVKRSEW